MKGKNMLFCLKYYVGFGKGDYSDTLDWEVELDEKQKKALIEALLFETNLNEVPELEDLCDQYYDEIKGQVCEELEDSEYSSGNSGDEEMDPDELTELVYERDPHALEFFGLEDATDEELDNWDANDLDELPLVKDFDEDFEEHDMFEDLKLVVELPDDVFANDVLTNDIIEEFIKDCMIDEEPEYVRKVIDQAKQYYYGDFDKAVKEIADAAGFKL